MRMVSFMLEKSVRIYITKQSKNHIALYNCIMLPAPPGKPDDGCPSHNMVQYVQGEASWRLAFVVLNCELNMH